MSCYKQPKVFRQKFVGHGMRPSANTASILVAVDSKKDAKGIARSASNTDGLHYLIGSVDPDHGLGNLPHITHFPRIAK